MFTEDSGGGGSGARGVGRQAEGNGRLSIVPGPRSRVGRRGRFEGEKRKFLSVQQTHFGTPCAMNPTNSFQ